MNEPTKRVPREPTAEMKRAGASAVLVGDTWRLMYDAAPDADAGRGAMADIIAERQRQISVEGWTAEHDDRHSDGELLRAAVIYLWHGTTKAAPMDGPVPLSWPWEPQWWKPKDRRRDLIRAGALCIAERERLARKGRGAAHVQQKLDIVVRELEMILRGDRDARIEGIEYRAKCLASAESDAGRVAELESLYQDAIRELGRLLDGDRISDSEMMSLLRRVNRQFEKRIAELDRRIERARSLIGSYGRTGQAGNLIKALATLSGDADG